MAKYVLGLYNRVSIQKKMKKANEFKRTNKIKKMEGNERINFVFAKDVGYSCELFHVLINMTW